MGSSINLSLADAKTQLSEIQRTLTLKRGQVDAIQETLDATSDEVRVGMETIDHLKLVETFLMQFADERQASVFRQIESTVSEGLQTVFEEDLRLEISSKVVGSRSEIVFTLVSGGAGSDELRTSIMESRGGGVAAITGFLIQAVMVLLTPNLRPIVFLDESFRAVSEEYQAPLGRFISELCERTGLQVVLVTHQPSIAEEADVVYSFTQSKGITKIKREV